MSESKKWYESKTLWTNVVAAIVVFVQSQFGYVIDPTIQVYIVLAINFILRFVTKSTIS